MSNYVSFTLMQEIRLELLIQRKFTVKKIRESANTSHWGEQLSN